MIALLTESQIGLTKALEDYLKVIYIIQVMKKKRVVRVRDIALFMHVRMSSVTSALKKLSDLGLINYSKRNYVELTDKGKELASQLYKRWEIIYLFLKDILKVKEETARRDACRIEHVISEETYDAIRRILIE